MEKFILTGKKTSLGIILELKIPSKKIYDDGSKTVRCILRAENNDIGCDEDIYDSLFPYRSPVTLRSELLSFAGFGFMFGSHTVANPNILDHIYSKHNYPLAQGPAIPILDQGQFGTSGKSLQQVFADRTEYSHDSSQGCHEWITTRIGLDAWNNRDNDEEGIASYGVKDIEISLEGAASMMDMSVVYTCTLHHCVIHCPCTVCNDSRDTCRKICRDFPCEDCNSQCKEHKLKLSRLFDPATDHFTMVTDQIDCGRYVIPYAGIPRSCKDCTRDVYEHQVLHHTFHGRCRYCVLEMRPFRNLTKCVDMKSFKKSAALIKQKDERTCGYCLSKLKDTYERKAHERITHEKKSSDHQCEECGKSYTNTTSLKYHLQNHKEEIEFPCDKCDKSFKSRNGLLTHFEIVHIHENTNRFLCEVCDKSFSTASHLSRHKRTKHYVTKHKNHDFAEALSDITEFACDQCIKKFKRKDVLKRHIKTVHDKNAKFNCPSCDRQFKRKYKLSYHLKSEHSETS
jgi:hypothetical protein